VTFHIVDIIARIVLMASICHSTLPPWDAEAFQPFPNFVKFYKVFIYIVGFVAVNGRSTVYQSISIQKAGGVNESVANEEARIAAPKV
jgi:hypothetical protein